MIPRVELTEGHPLSAFDGHERQALSEHLMEAIQVVGQRGPGPARGRLVSRGAREKDPSRERTARGSASSNW